jgi:tRNA-splicing ligase RtcB
MAFHAVPVAPFEYELRDDADRARPARIFADDQLIAAIARDRSLQQLANVTLLPGLYGNAYGMPDMHEGYGFPVGGVAATALPDGVISPGGIGFDINCGVRLLATELENRRCPPEDRAARPRPERSIPRAGRGGTLKPSDVELDRLAGMSLPGGDEHGRGLG